MSAAYPHRVFLRKAQARQGFARIENMRLGVGNGVDINTRCAGYAGQQLQEIQGAAFGGQ